MGLGKRLRAWFSAAPAAPEPVVRHEMFAVSPTYPVDQLSFLRVLRGQAIDRAAALGVPAVLRGRNLICGDISTLPLQLIDADNNVQDHPLFRQIDANTANVVMLAQTVEDLLFEAKAWWRVTERTADGYPAKAARYAPGDVSLQPPDDYRKGYLPSGLPTEGVVWMEGKPVPFRDVIRFDSPNPGFLVAGERAIRRALALDEAADLYAANPRRRGFFTTEGGAPDPDETEIDEFLDDWQQGARERLDGWAPGGVKYVNAQDPTPAELQILAQQQRADLTIANALGIDPEDLGISTTSRTYQNATDRRQDRVNDVLSPYMRAVTDRLSMPDVTKRGYTARFWLDDYLKADPKTRAEVQQMYRDMEVIDAQDIQQSEGLPPHVIEAPAPVRPAVPPTQISAIPAGAR